MMGTDLFDVLLGIAGDGDNILTRMISSAKQNYDYINNIRSTRSIKSMTKDLILHYPFLCSDDLTIQTDRLATRAGEADYTQMILILLNSNFSSKLSDGEDAATFLKRFHTNISYDKSNFNEAHLDLLEPYENTLNEDVLNEFSIPDTVLEEAFNIMLEASKNGTRNKYKTSYQPDDKEKEKRNYEIEKERNKREWEKSEYKRKQQEEKKKYEQRQKEEKQKYERRQQEEKEKYERRQQEERERYERQQGEKDEKEKREYERRQQQEKEKYERRQQQEKENYERRQQEEKERYEQRQKELKAEKEADKAERDKKEQELKDKQTKEFEFKARNTPSVSNAKTITQEIKKINAQAPIVVNCDINIADKDTQTMITKKITFGVKGICHLLKSEDIVYYFSDTVRDKSKLFRFIQWTTGEIKLVRDLIVSLDSVKKMAIQNKYADTFWWRKLSSLAKTNKMKKLLSGPTAKTAVATSTFVISKKEVDSLKYNHGIDLLNSPSAVNKLMNNFFMLGFMIMDEATQIAYIFNTENMLWEQFSFSQLDKYGAELKENNKDNPIEALRSLLRG